MSKMPVNVELPEEIWKIIDNNLTKWRIRFSNTIKNHQKTSRSEWILSRC